MHKVTQDEFDRSDLHTIISTESGLKSEPVNELKRRDDAEKVLAYVAEMRAWNCCHQGQEPIDGLPEKPDTSYVEFE